MDYDENRSFQEL